jgi:hypothetical protein
MQSGYFKQTRFDKFFLNLIMLVGLIITDLKNQFNHETDHTM